MKKIVCLLSVALALTFTTDINAQQVKEKTKKGWSKKAKGAAIGTAVGAGTGALIGGGKGAIIGGAVGAGGGYLYVRHRDKKYPERTIKHKRKVEYKK